MSIFVSPQSIQLGTQAQYTANFTVPISGTVTLTANPAYVTFGQPSVSSGGLPVNDVIYGAGSQTINVQAVTGTAGARTLVGQITCTQQGTFYLLLTVPGSTSIQSNAVTCGFGFLTPTPSFVTAPRVQVAAAPTSVNCNGASLIAASIKDQFTNQPVPNGTQVSFTSTGGTVSPSTATTSGGEAGAIFSAPNTSGTVTITANSGGQSGTTSITVTCQQAPTPVPQLPPTVVIPQIPSIPQLITPPNTGDAGLADGGRGLEFYGGLVLMAASALAAAAVVRVRA